MAAAQIGGVLEPVNANPVVIEDDVLVGGNTGIYEGTIVRERAVLASGVILTRATPIFDLPNDRIIKSDGEKPLEVPAGAVVVQGSRAITSGFGKENGLSIYCPIIVKYRDEKTDASTRLEDYLRQNPNMHKQHLPDLDERARQAMLDNGFEPDFPMGVEEQIRKLESEPPASSDSDIRDLRELLWSSIDNKSSKDLDQVEYAEELPNGDIRLLVGIADVDELVAQGSAIDKHADVNTVTVYTESEIFPVLPEELSADLTSLREGEDRRAIIVELVVKENGDVPGNNVFRALIRNQAKLAYDDLGAWLDANTDEPQKIADTIGLKDQIIRQKMAAERLHKFRLEKGALEFESVESSAVVVDGEIREIEAVKTNSARHIIENFMIAANVEMAEFLDLHGSPSIRRVVKTPERWGGIQRIAAEFGTHLPDVPDATGAFKVFGRTPYRRSGPFPRSITFDHKAHRQRRIYRQASGRGFSRTFRLGGSRLCSFHGTEQAIFRLDRATVG